jgi:prepilin-type processing-associated H-X9-DG protein
MPQKLSQIIHPPPTQTFVFIDEHQDSIDDGLWNTDPGALAVPGEPGLAPGRSPPGWYNFPAHRHNQAANIAFADGYVIRHRWLWLKRKWAQPNPTHEVGPVNQLDTQDLIYTLTICPVQ